MTKTSEIITGSYGVKCELVTCEIDGDIVYKVRYAGSPRYWKNRNGRPYWKTRDSAMNAILSN